MRKLFAASLTAALVAQTAWADHTHIEEVLVVSDRYPLTINLADAIDVAPDASALLKKSAGANAVNNGPLTGIAQYRGMSRFRVNTQINGATISAGGPNWMDSPLSYAPAALLESLEVHRGIAPVSAGAETIGGAINAKTWQGEFTAGDTAVNGKFQTGFQSVNNSRLLSGSVAIASDQYLVYASGLQEDGDDAEFPEGKVLPSEYTRQRADTGIGYHTGNHTIRINYARNETGDTGTPALPMDIGYIDSDLGSISWDYKSSALEVNSKLFYSDIEHGMTNYHLRQAPADAGMFRRNIATGDNLGAAISTKWNTWHIGLDAHKESHDSDIDNPNNAMFFVDNFNNAKRRLVGIYAEKTTTLNQALSLELGARFNRVDMDAGTVNATPAAMGMPAAVALRDAFNNADRSSTDNNIDWVAKLHHQTSNTLQLYAGLARKTRSPAYQEKFLWLPLQATAGLADGRTYTGNLSLNPEIAHEIELGFDWQTSSTRVSPRIFYRDVSDYIQGTEPGAMAAIMFVNMMNAMNGTNNAAPLQFNNVDATFYGLDIDWRHQINHHWSMNGVVNFVRGKRDDIKTDVYRVAPANAMVAINYKHADWAVSVESFVYRKQDKVSATNRETPTSGYGLINLKGSWQATNNLKLGFGIDNVTDRHYVDHLAGVNRAGGNPDIAKGQRLPGYGRNIFARIDYSW